MQSASLRLYRRRLMLATCLPGYAMPWLFAPWRYGFPAVLAGNWELTG